MESESGPTDQVAADAPLAPGAETELVIPFAAKVPWKGEVDPAHMDPKAKGSWKRLPGTGNDYRSNVTTGIVLLSDQTPGAKSLLVTSIVAGQPELKLPDWLGQRPPVEGEWVQTLAEEFDGDTIDLQRWNVQSSNWWDKRMHFSKDQIIVKDGHLTLRMEKKPGHHNDDPAGAFTDYAAGQPDTYGKWTQRYGYFEIRQKQPTAKCCWPGFWMMPDRGAAFGRRSRLNGRRRHGVRHHRVAVIVGHSPIQRRLPLGWLRQRPQGLRHVVELCAGRQRRVHRGGAFVAARLVRCLR